MFAECKNCKWRSDNFTSVCVNGESERRADFVCEDDSCEKWEEKEMDERERVIYDIERCICCAPDACRDCSKYSDDSTVIRCMEELLKDALALLKAQEPRVMTLEEVCAAVQKNATLFTECEKENQWVTEGMAHFSDLALFNDSKYDNCKITFIRHTYDGTQKNEWYVRLKNYNKTWRCWTACPTKTQKEREKWENLK